MATYYVRADGTAANKAAATSKAAASTSMPPATFNSQSFSGDDVVVFSGLGGVFRYDVSCPSSGTSGHRITYRGEDSAKFSGADLVSGWTVSSGNVWQATLASAPLTVYMDGTLGDERSGTGDMSKEFDWYHSGSTLYVYAPADPDTRYTSPGVEASVRSYAFRSYSQDHINIEDIETYQSKTDGLRISGAPACTDVTISGCVSHDIGYQTATYCDGIQTNNVSNLVVSECEVYRCGWNGIGISAGWDAGNDSSNVTIEKCYVHENDHNGIDVKAVVSNISNVTVKFCRATTSGDNGLYCLNAEAGVSVDNITYIGNVSFGNNSRGLAIASTSGPIHDTCKVYNNTFAFNGQQVGDYGSGLYVWCTNSDIKNNVIAENNQAEDFFIEINVDDNDGDPNVADYNLIFRTGQTSIVRWNGTNRTQSTWVSADGQNANGLNTDPLFTDSDNDDFTLSSSSPCIGAGVNLGASYDDALLPSSTWPDGVVTGDQDDY